MTSYKDLIVWQKSKELTVEIYKTTKNFPKEELYGLTSQIRRASVSIPSNIAEGNVRNGKKEYIQFLHIALGSSAELNTQIDIAKELEYIDNKDYTRLVNLIDEVAKILNTIIKKLSAN